MPLPRDFLIEMARKHELSAEQEDAFVIWFSSNKTALEVATELHIENNTLTTRMGHVYKKFSINGKGPGKYGRLLNFLTAEYRKSKPSDSPTSNLSEDELNDLVEEVRQKWCEVIQDQCGTMRSLTMSQPIDVSDFYTNVNILEKIPSRQWREVDELVQDCNPENFSRLGLGRITDRGIPGLEAVEKYSKLMILGKPGAGKTTFLKHLAIQCNQGKFQEHRVPIFITLKQFAEAEGQPSLLEYITQMVSDCDISVDQIAVLLKHGKILVLLDGLDEVKVEDNNRVIKQVRDFSDKFRQNQFVMTCRIAANKYNFEKFTEVEVSDFDGKQISTFIQNWFQTKEPAKAEKLIQQLRKNDPIRELATNPLLLTLLCLVFEKSAKFPSSRSELYKDGVDILLKKWDKEREIEREQVYKNLSLQRKKDLLSQIALTTFEKGDYFFKQKELEQYISDYIRNLPDAQNDRETLQLDSEAVLKSIEAQHGLLVERAQKIYSFSHLTFQEYFTAIEIVKNSEIQGLESLARHILDSRWREVFLLVAEMLPSANQLLQLMKRQIDALIAEDLHLQKFLTWICHKSRLVSTPYRLPALRAFYFENALLSDDILQGPVDASGYFFDDINTAYDFSYNLDKRLLFQVGNIPKLEIAKVHKTFLILEIDRTLSNCLYPARVLAGHEYGEGIGVDESEDLNSHLHEQLYRVIEYCTHLKNYKLLQVIQELKNQLLPNLPSDSNEDCKKQRIDKVLKWWEENGEYWFNNLISIMVNECNLVNNWQFSDQQYELLREYHQAHLFIMECLNSVSINKTPEVRLHIEENLLLPIVEIENSNQIS